MKIKNVLAYIVSICMIMCSLPLYSLSATSKNELTAEAELTNNLRASTVEKIDLGDAHSINQSKTNIELLATDTSVLSINKTTASILEGSYSSITATVNPSSQTVSWSSSNTTVATVSAQGTSCTVNAHKAGKATLTASTTVNGEVYTAQCIVYVRVLNGVYYIKNLNSNYYLHTQDGKILNQTPVIQYTKYASSASNDYKVRQMWRIHYLDNGRYSIRPMHKLNMGLDVTGGNVDIYNINTDDTLSGVPSYAEWSIEWDSSGYVFKLTDSDSFVMQVANASTSLSSTIVASSYPTNTNAYKWSIERISIAPSGVILYNTTTGSMISGATKYIAPEETLSLSSMSLAIGVYSSVYIDQVPDSWNTSSTAYASVDQATGAVTGVSKGTVTISAVVDGDTASYTLNITEIPNGVYLLQNKQTGCYVDIYGPTIANGTTIHQWAFNGGKSQKWKFTHLGDGYYSIRQTYSNASYYLGVKNDSTTVDSDIVLRNGSITNGMKWKVETTSSGAMKLIPNIGESSGYVLATSASNATNGAKLIQGAYVSNTSYRDEWYLQPITDYSLVYLGYSQYYASYMQNIINNVTANLYNNANATGYSTTSITKDELLFQLATTNFFNIITHGDDPNQLILSNDVVFEMSELSALNSNALSSMKVACITACKSGEGGTEANNTVNALYDMGAQCVIGFIGNIETDAADMWTEAFVNNLSLGNTVEQARQAAKSVVDNSELIYREIISVDISNQYLVGSGSIRPFA